MIVEIKYFYEKTDEDYETYNKLWNENKARFIFLHTNLSAKKQITSIFNDLDTDKDILAVRFTETKEIKRNKIINDILLGNGIRHNNTVWYPKEIWIYSPIK
jgi:hypothetical protein